MGYCKLWLKAMLTRLKYKPIIQFILIGLLFGIADASGQPPLTDSQIVGPKGGSLSVEDPATGMTVMLNIPENALRRDTSITLSVLSSSLAKPIADAHIKGISISPKGLYLQEKADLMVANPPKDVTDRMLLYSVINSQFAIPCASLKVNPEENSVTGGIFVLGEYCLGTPSKQEIQIQSKKLVAYNPAKPLACVGSTSDNYMLMAENGIPDAEEFRDEVLKYNLSTIPGYFTDETEPELSAFADVDCLRWQKVMVKVEGIMMWAEYAILTGNTQMENQTRHDAEKALQDAIDDFMKQTPPANPCVNHVKAAAKYIEAGTKLGLNVGQGSPIDQRFSQLVNQCSFTFSVEFREWISHPKETLKDDATYEERLNRYGTIQCYMPYNQFLATGESAVKGNGVMTISYDNHWVGYEKNSHETQRGKITASKVEGNIMHWVDGFGQPHLQANITIFWKKEVMIHTWGVGVDHEVFDMTDMDNSEYAESKVIPLVNGEFVNIGNAEAGMKISVFGIKAPGDGRENPDDCF